MKNEIQDLSEMIRGVCTRTQPGRERTQALKACQWRFLAAQGVESNWDKGDLAKSVRRLSRVVARIKSEASK